MLDQPCGFSGVPWQTSKPPIGSSPSRTPSGRGAQACHWETVSRGKLSPDGMVGWLGQGIWSGRQERNRQLPNRTEQDRKSPVHPHKMRLVIRLEAQRAIQSASSRAFCEIVLERRKDVSAPLPGHVPEKHRLSGNRIRIDLCLWQDSVRGRLDHGTSAVRTAAIRPQRVELTGGHSIQ